GPGGLPGQVAGAADAGVGVGELVGDGLEAADGAVELYPLLGVGVGQLQVPGGATDKPGREGHHAVKTHRRPGGPATAGGADAGALGDLDIGELHQVAWVQGVAFGAGEGYPRSPGVHQQDVDVL